MRSVRALSTTDSGTSTPGVTAISPNPKLNPLIPNEDSVAFDFDDTNLFQFNKSPGFDLYEGGQRLNVGEQATFQWGDGLNATLLLGRTFRVEPTDVFPSKTGLNGTASDWVLAAERSGVTYGLRLPGVDIAPGRGELQSAACLQALALYGVS